MRRLVIDLDGTLTVDADGISYPEKSPNRTIIDKLKEYKRDGFEIIIATSRNMRTHNNSVGKINAFTLPVIIDWLKKHDVPYDEIHIGKPWCGQDGFYVDDRSIRPDEFSALGYDGVRTLLGMDKPGRG